MEKSLAEAPPEGKDAPGDRVHGDVDAPLKGRWLLLGALTLLAVFLGLEPLLTFSSWGSDSGEYAYLTAGLLAHGSFLLQGYQGWGFGYPYFPGMFEVGGGVAAATGVDPLLTLEFVVPTLAAVSTVPVFLLFRRLYPSDPVALLGAGLVAVAFPRVFILSHAVPAALGDLLAVSGLWMLVEQRRDPRWWALLLPVSFGLVVTHHLSCYFFLLSALGLVVGVELYAPRRWSRRFPLRELLYLGGFTVGLFAFWLGYAPPFATILMEGVPGAPVLALPLAALAVIAFLGVLVLLRRRGFVLGHRPLWRAKWPPRSHLARDGGLLAVLLLAGLSYLLFFPLPATADLVPWTDLLWFAPFLAVIPLVAGGRGFGSLTRLGSAPMGWFGFIAVSAAFALRTANEAIPPDRHVEFLALPLLLLAAITLGRVLSTLHASADRRPFAVALGLVVLLVGANAAVAYPPPSLLEGFQEGLAPSDMGVVSWAATGLPGQATLASDHRLSDLYFGETGRPATWDSAKCLFVGNNTTCALQELRGLRYPLFQFAPRPLDAIAVDPTMREQGVALNPNAPALPMSVCSEQLLEGPGFVEIYEQGGTALYWVDLNALPPSGPTVGACAGG